ncbi:hypothetical protein [Thermoflavimicrobium daqui]|uniref:Uncharacterized protein n=1 Tax=Thermoflavimicrobium daqui TaxID=2137476 RepID=A0A364K6L2_9BACL|nr:hypothetical protein [Thermoflavimicrobium daqui]RAL25949.1 hypothetical protein DL897_07720 [Thermoflavimicrobium daqui]
MKKQEAFIKGIKPALLCSHTYEHDIFKKLLSLKYPNIIEYELKDFDNPDEIFDRGTLFFQSEDMKEKYLNESKGLKKKSREAIILLGKVLGYPPIACEFFADSEKDISLRSKRVVFDYYGIRFAGNMDDRDEICKWLWENVKAPPAEVKIESRNGVQIQIVEPSVVSI